MKTPVKTLWLIIFLLPHTLAAQNIVRGIVIDSTTQEALIGTNVLVKGTALGGVADREGRFRIAGVSDGPHVLRITYIGYLSKEIPINVVPGEEVSVNVQLVPDVLEGEEIVITAQARGQIAAINQQLNSNTIVNVVSEEKIKELPDANAAEAIGRLPGVSLIRSGGEASKVILRGMSDKFTSFTVDGVRVPPTDPDSRGVDMSTFSQGTLAGIELFKALTPDKDGDAIAGSINLVTRKAPSERSIRIDAKSAYNRLEKSADQYNFSGKYGERFFDDVLGVQAIGNLEKSIRSSEAINVAAPVLASNSQPLLSTLTVQYTDELRKRSGASLLFDVNTPDSGSVRLNTIYSRTDRDFSTFSRTYPTAANPSYGIRTQEQVTNTFNSTLHGQNFLSDMAVTWGLSFAQSKSDNPYDYRMSFFETTIPNQSGMRDVPNTVRQTDSPELLIPYALNSFANSVLDTAYYKYQKNLDKEKTAYLDLSKNYVLSDLLSGVFKFGGKYRYKNRFKESSELVSYYSQGFFRPYVRLADGTLQLKSAAFQGTRFQNLQTGAQNPRLILLTNFLDASPATRNLFDRYSLNPLINRDALRDWYNLNKNGVEQNGTPEYYNNPETSADGYDIVERVGAAYIMNTLNLSNLVTFIAGVRIERESNDYHANYVSSALGGFPTVGTLLDTTSTFKETTVLPNFHLTLRPTDFMSIRLAGYRALARPDFNYRLDKYIVRITNPADPMTAGNSRLKNATAWNYEVNTSFFGNSIGLVTVSAFYRNIQDMFHLATNLGGTGNFLLDTLGITWRPPIPAGSPITLTVPYNNSKPTKVWGFEFEHQANLNFLPGLLQYMTLSYNFSLTRSETFVLASRVDTTYQVIHDPDLGDYTVPVFHTRYIDSRQKLESQPEFYGNVALGYDIGGFSGRISVFFQGAYTQSYSTTGGADQIVDKFSRVDLSVKQRVTDFLSIYLNLNNLTGVEEPQHLTASNYGWSRLSSNTRYGLTGDLGVRLEF